MHANDGLKVASWSKAGHHGKSAGKCSMHKCGEVFLFGVIPAAFLWDILHEAFHAAPTNPPSMAGQLGSQLSIRQPDKKCTVGTPNMTYRKFFFFFWGITLCNVVGYTYIMKSSRELICVM